MNWMGPARGYRGRILQFKNREFTLAAETLGATPMRIIYRHILPNILGNIVVSLTSFVPPPSLWRRASRLSAWALRRR